VDDRVDVLHGQLEPGAGDEVALDPVVGCAFTLSAAENSRAMTCIEKALHDLAAQGARSTSDEHVHDG
jgi:hypothetical protein